jgi:uncharacterized membrane protein YozB (DUF420 family)
MILEKEIIEHAKAIAKALKTDFVFILIYIVRKLLTSANLKIF